MHVAASCTYSTTWQGVTGGCCGPLAVCVSSKWMTGRCSVCVQVELHMLVLPCAGKLPAAGREGSGLLQGIGKPGNGGRGNQTPH